MLARNVFFKIIVFLNLFFFTTFINAQNVDSRILRQINSNRDTALDPTFKGITHTAVPISVASPFIIYSIGLLKKDSTLKKQAVSIGQTFLVAAFVTTALKYSTQRVRPFDANLGIEKQTSGPGFSFPSGHTSAAFATATALSFDYPKWYIIGPSFAWASAVGYSRMHLGVHYPSDVLVGAIVESGSAYINYKMNNWINKKRIEKHKKL